MKSSKVLMHIDLKCIDITALTQRKNFSTCLRDSPFFLENNVDDEVWRFSVLSLTWALERPRPAAA